MTHVNDIGNDFLGVIDLEGRPRTATIESFESREFPAKDRNGRDYMKKKWVLKLANQPKRWIVNKTNQDAIVFLLGPFLEEWIGKRITLIPDKTQFGGGTVDCIRVRPAQQPPQIGASSQPQPQPRNGGNFAPVNRDAYQTMERQPVQRLQQAPKDAFDQAVDDIADTF